jgi:hypothetical protein
MLRAVLAALIVVASTAAQSESTSSYPQIIPAPNDAAMTPDQRALQAYEAYRFAAANRNTHEPDAATVKERCPREHRPEHAT